MKNIVMKVTSIGIAVAALAFSLNTVAQPAGAGEKGKPSGIACQQAGIATLQALGLLPAVAKDGIEVQGIGVLDFQEVLSLHRSNPELFDGGSSAVTVIVNGDGVLANWCSTD